MRKAVQGDLMSILPMEAVREAKLRSGATRAAGYGVETESKVEKCREAAADC